jgi:hypothetical protein
MTTQYPLMNSSRMPGTASKAVGPKWIRPKATAAK